MNENQNESEKEKYAVLGNEPIPGQPKKVFLVPIEDYSSIDPKAYFVTTGEATVKIDVLIEDLQNMVRHAKNLKKELIKTKGESDYLETCWEDGDLLVKKKEKRTRAPFKKKKA
jgi:hypothetical protein